jgi:hypothetical protein
VESNQAQSRPLYAAAHRLKEFTVDEIELLLHEVANRILGSPGQTGVSFDYFVNGRPRKSRSLGPVMDAVRDGARRRILITDQGLAHTFLLWPAGATDFKAPKFLYTWNEPPAPDDFERQLAAVIDLMVLGDVHCGWVSLESATTSLLYENHGGGYWYKDAHTIEGTPG